MSILKKSAIRVNVQVSTWQEAVRAAGELLVQNGHAEPAYVDGMVHLATTLGPYIVMTPGIAIPHARPEDGAINVGIAAVKLAEPVEFGNEDNDPVHLVLAFCTPNAEAHIEVLSQLAENLEQDNLLENIIATQTVEDIQALF